ncbi:two-component system chemotaxis sensor kinase CheA [Rhodoligotrophos appendicifer]|uniref:response regulator n=1 Tax=Rhodoligotrophos appendicifer TaxID=987056 RepID=UPI001185C7ED|nr:response regulator [Rhodoligotrophos appendicifer]
MQSIRDQLLAAFDAEHREHLAAIRHALTLAEKGLAADFLDVFRRAHSLKGAARAVDMPDVEELAHHLETLFSEVANGERTLDRPLSLTIERVLDSLEAHVAAVLAGESPPAVTSVLADMDAAPAAEPAPANATVAGQAPENPPEIMGAPDTAPVQEYLRIRAETVTKASQSAHELARAIQSRTRLDQELKGLAGQLHALESTWGKLRGTLQKAGNSYERFSAFQSDLRTVTRQFSRLVQKQRRSQWLVEQLGKNIRTDVERLSLVSAESVFGSFGRMTRDIARGDGKVIEVQMEGLELLVDRGLLQALKDPLMHLLRNAVSHGAEMPSERLAAGKPEAVQISLALQSRGSQLEIRVSDDGRGLDFDRIEKIAAERGLLEANPGISRQQQLTSVLLRPGFTTSREIDRLSGRGIGLSVVHEAIRKMHGSLDIKPGNSGGTEVIISVPMSMSRQALVMVSAGNQIYGIPAHAVEKVMRVHADDLGTITGQPVVSVELEDGELTTTLRGLETLVAGAGVEIPAEAGRIRAILVRSAGDHCALAVDELLDVDTHVIEDPLILGADRTLISGVVVLEDGTPALVLSPEGLAERWRLDGGRPQIGEIAARGADPIIAQKVILVVDDSITTRTLEKNLLETQGFRVLVSVDGIDALDTLRRSMHVDLVLADIEMPRMDGFGLLTAMKSDPRLESIPVVMMTSRAAPEDIKRGLDLGADAYITKQKFDQRELLATINQLI